jgi:hypothetical protein
MRVRLILATAVVFLTTGPASAATTTVKTVSGPEPKAVAAAVTASASPVASRLGAKLGRPTCPPVEKPRVGLTLQCTVAFEKSPVAWLVTLKTGGVLEATPTFPVISKRQAELLAGTGSTCSMAPFVGVPIGATVTCTVAKATTTLRVAPDGTLTK